MRIPLRRATIIMSKRLRSPSQSPNQAHKHNNTVQNSNANPPSPSKRTKQETKFLPNKIASAEVAAQVDHDQPLFKLLDEVQHHVKNPAKGDAVVYWMRMQDMRSTSWQSLHTLTAY